MSTYLTTFPWFLFLLDFLSYCKTRLFVSKVLYMSQEEHIVYISIKHSLEIKCKIAKYETDKWKQFISMLFAWFSINSVY